MISQHLAEALQAAGVRWRPAAGDRFVIPQPALAGELFTLSEMTIEARDYPTGTILGFNGTTEWAMDSVAQDDALWMPREDQLRALLGGTFRTLQRGSGRPGPTVDGAVSGEGAVSDDGAGDVLGAADPTALGAEHGVADPAGGPGAAEAGEEWFEVTVVLPSGAELAFVSRTAADAYARALLALVASLADGAGAAPTAGDMPVGAPPAGDPLSAAAGSPRE